ncbi:MAG: tetratricopeptide repeat protein, partial [Muribaculaceae bacterium]|nr:tetratricopeptide repeat protein [Muribaculaceae bacterium]
YYGGRVYSDLGDYPTALRYFQQALDEMPESDDRKFLNLKGTVLSQTGRLLNTLRLYDEAISYIEKSLFTDSIMNDSVGLMYNTELLGAVYIGAENYDTAEIKLKQSFHIADKLSHDFRFVLLAQLAEIKYHQGFVDSALILLRPALKHIHKADSSYVLSCAAKIYHQAGILDTAFIYARELIWNKHSYNRAMGYEIITSPELIKFIPADSLPIYLSGHRSVMVNSLKKNESQQALIQNSRYNYHLHERERIKAESSRDRLRLWLVVIVLSVLLVISLLVGVIIYQKARNRKSLLRLHDALDRISLLRYSLDSKEICLETLVSDSQTSEIKRIDSPLSETEQLRILKERLRKELMSLADKSGGRISVSDIILSSAACAGLREYLERDMPVPENSALWGELEETVSLASVYFRDRINLLTGGKLKPIDYHTVLLLKCGFTPTQISKLLGRAKSSIGSKRESLSVKL